MKTFITALIAFAAGGLLMFLALRKQDGDESDEKEHAAERSGIVAVTNGQRVLRLSEEKQKEMGIRLESIRESERKPEVRAFAQFAEFASLIDAAQKIRVASIALEASKKEFARVRQLYDQNQNASLRSVEAAETAVKQDEAALDVATAQLKNSWGREIGDRQDLPAFTTRLLQREDALVRVDWPVEAPFREAPRQASIELPDEPGVRRTAELIGPAIASDSNPQLRSFYYRVPGMNRKPGTPAWAWLPGTDAALRGLEIPIAAVIRNDGQTFVYVSDPPGEFHRVPIARQFSTAKGWFIKPGLASNGKIVVSGAQQLQSEELKSGWEEKE